MVIEAILWDLDGTLISTKRLYLEAYRRALEPYIGRAMTDEEIMSHRARSEIRFLRAHAADRYDECTADFRRHYGDLHATHFDGIYPDVIEVLDALRARGMPMGIVTGKSRSSWEIGKLTADLGQFDVLVMDDDVSEPKPSPEGILAAVDALKVDAQHTIYVGDSTTDIAAALAAGTIAAAALWSKPVDDHAGFMGRLEGPVIGLAQPADLFIHI